MNEIVQSEIGLKAGAHPKFVNNRITEGWTRDIPRRAGCPCLMGLSLAERIGWNKPSEYKCLLKVPRTEQTP